MRENEGRAGETSGGVLGGVIGVVEVSREEVSREIEGRGSKRIESNEGRGLEKVSENSWKASREIQKNHRRIIRRRE